MCKRKFLVCAAMVAMLIAGSAAPLPAADIIVENFSFELPDNGKQQCWDGELDGSTDVPGWTDGDESSVNSGVETGWRPTDGTWTGFIMALDPPVYNLTDHVITAGEVFTVLVDAENNYTADPPGVAILRISLFYDDNGNHVEMGAVTYDDLLNGTKQEYSLTCDSGLFAGSNSKNLGIKLENVSEVAIQESWIGLDNVRLSYTGGGGPVLVYPVGVENLENYFPTLLWNKPAKFDTLLYYIYLDPNQVNISEISKMVEPDPGSPLHINVKYEKSQLSDPNEYAIPNPDKELEHGVRYYWKMEAYNAAEPNYYSSVVASFTTMPDNPVILQQPQSITAAENTDAVFELSALNTEEYHWYKVQAGEDPEVGEPNIPTLTINVQIEDEGFYYCVLSNAKGSVTTDTARLMMERRVALWTFEETINSVVVGNEDAFTGTYIDPNLSDAITPVPVYNNAVPAPGGSGFALVLTGDTPESEDNDAGEGVVVSDPNFFNFYPQGVTISAWVKTTGVGADNWTGIACKQNRETAWIGWVLQQNNYTPVFGTRDASGDIYGDETGSLLSDINEDTSNTWHMVTGTYGSDDDEDGSRETRIYLDGYLEGQGESTATMTTHAMPVIIGAQQTNGFSSFDGLIDNVEIYNYPLSRYAVAKKYVDMVPGATVCIEDETDTDMDFNNDCIVDMKDLAEFATDWLDCFIVPDCITSEP